MCFKIRSPCDSTHMALSAFTCYVYEKNNHQRLVADLQGFGEYLTDPLILDINNAWVQETNTAEEEIQRFNKQHRCYEICHKLGLLFPPGQEADQNHSENMEKDFIEDHIANGGNPDFTAPENAPNEFWKQKTTQDRMRLRSQKSPDV
ncbi:uncharacterized protein MELLADRAFT_89728 [Melampsora larici-populina 98AG31]|uniref:Alpha-type protein kinase domain-containing protein n=1 Tax=Melampsora larici-populina (strain 98AG31 / pathotype 3-4-7) TaxID=747676 RepID=F4RUE4_MELLP|nr:uncharacterized protein MELLADRAFT_89728 [Melampsora larici-populina 98AG31]EGG04011.1 hypothetical protein MELLADRAFT_89728 [Melampsora larici-populina 98AG31]